MMLLEVSGSLKLFGGLGEIAARLRQGLVAMGYSARLAAAPTSPRPPRRHPPRAPAALPNRRIRANSSG